MADLESVKVLQKTVIVPEYIDYPETRIPIGPGVLQKGARVRVKVNVVDKDGLDVMPETLYVTKFTEYPTDPTKEVLGMVRVSFNESGKVVS